jgi:DNA polymerase I-like protein with 3'-5' exonuclease and polymerase domains
MSTPQLTGLIRNKSSMTERALLFLGTEADRNFLHYLKPHLKGHKCFIDTKPVSTIAEVEIYAKSNERGITGVISTSVPLLARFTGKESPSLDAYSGSYFKRNGIEYVFINPLEHAVTVPYGDFLLERFVGKLSAPEKWLKAPEFNWCVLTPQNWEREYAILSSPNVIALASDDETFRHNLAIRCIGFTTLSFDGTEFKTRSIVLPLDSLWALQKAREIADLPAAKIFQNGKYDQSYNLRYNIVMRNWLWDTKTFFHCWYSELPKDLAFLQSFFVREAAYWKDLAETNDLETYYLYNAKDTWATACSMLAWMMEAPQYARDNYLKEFPLLYPCLLSEMTGVKRDYQRLEKAKTDINLMLETKRQSLDKMLGVKGFNPNSPKQMSQLFKILGCGHLGSTDDKAMAKAIYMHPLNSRILGIVRGVPKTDEVEKMGMRSMVKMRGTYLDETKDFRGRWLYAINPDETDTSRAKSKEHHFWCGAQIQNVPVGATVKQTIVADDDFYLAECDLEQAETRHTAYITGDKNLLTAINSGRDFHALNVQAFFGLAYETIYDDATGKVLNKPIRNIGKRVNHGANYNMGPDVLVDTMGEEQVYEAARLLKLPRNWTAREIAAYLLERFDITYPVVRSKKPGGFQEYIIAQIKTTKKLVNALGYTRYCFGNPATSKPALNSYVATLPQGQNAQALNIAFMKVFYDIAIHPEHRKNFRLLAQIHDSIFFQYRKGHEYLASMVKERMEIPILCKDIGGIERTFTVPAALKLGKVDKKTGELVRATYWSETE